MTLACIRRSLQGASVMLQGVRAPGRRQNVGLRQRGQPSPTRIAFRDRSPYSCAMYSSGSEYGTSLNERLGSIAAETSVSLRPSTGAVGHG